MVCETFLPIRNDNLVKAAKAIEAIEKRKLVAFSEEEENYEVEVLSTLGFIACSQGVKIAPGVDEKKLREEDKVRRKVSLRLLFKVPAKDFVTYLLVRNADMTDIRKYKIAINSIFKAVKMNLTMKSAVRK
jgi:hypothetical protein